MLFHLYSVLCVSMVRLPFRTNYTQTTCSTTDGLSVLSVPFIGRLVN